MNLAVLTDSSFHVKFLHSMQLLFDSILPTLGHLLKLESTPSKPVPVLLIILSSLLPFQQSSLHLHQEMKINWRWISWDKFFLKKPFSLLIYKKQLLIHSSSIMRLQHFSNIFSLHLKFQFSCYFHHIYKTSCTKVLNPLKSSMRTGINFFQTLFMMIFSPLLMSHKCPQCNLGSQILSRFSVCFAQIHQSNHYPCQL